MNAVLDVKLAENASHTSLLGPEASIAKVNAAEQPLLEVIAGPGADSEY